MLTGASSYIFLGNINYHIYLDLLPLALMMCFRICPGLQNKKHRNYEINCGNQLREEQKKNLLASCSEA